MKAAEYILIIVISYLLGSLSISIVLSSNLLGGDVRGKGSGNAGATNMARVFGIRMGVLTLIGDMLKTALALALGYVLVKETGMAAAGIASLIGHCYPVYYGFKGGKGVSSGTAIAFALDYRAGLIAFAVFALVVFSSKKVSLASISAALTLPAAALLLSLSPARCVLAIFTMCLVLRRHSENIKRLIKGTEPDFKPAKRTGK